MRRTFGALFIAAASLLADAPASLGQVTVGGPAWSSRVQSYYSAPGYYGTSYGIASYGVRQTYTTFTSSFGPGYGYGYAPSSFVPGPYGAYLWNPGTLPNRAVWRTPYYGTFAVPTAPAGVAPPPIGVYAPSFGPGVPPVMYGW